MSELDIEALQAWVGHEESRSDKVGETALTQFRCTLEDHLVERDIEVVPPGFHWTLFPPIAPTTELGEDGHPRTVGLLPEMPLPARMWAGGTVVLRAPLQPGDEVVRNTQVSSIEAKAGGSGPLIFVKLDHEAFVGERAVISETQNLVYRNPSAPAATASLQGESEGTPFRTNTCQLFRYSALTFNSHRIHFDQAYARDVEGYPDLVVHGPLQATMMLNYLAKSLGHARIGLRYRGVSPLYVNERAWLFREGGESGDVRVERSPGQPTMKGQYAPASQF
ncbi:FAS1-like dehydratase domain-containing protein [Henriciella aquimarina]|uniref:FAS1-like dehydratase domain-containing protein n=1 Tax=Henriciella aquimarina TaxID=545261 RepID=UPI0009FF3A19|nr:MaoC family dehydratase N-terminal domain-containing protein [Henriciella aquimarina]